MNQLRLSGLAAIALVSAAPMLTGCSADDSAASADDITEVNHTDVERQSIGNCWLYAQATWVESMHLTATGDEFDVSQSYWTYWHWYGELTGWMWGDEISTGGNQWTSNSIVRERGVMDERVFVPEDTTGEMSNRQKTALNKINSELKEGGRLETRDQRRDKELVRDVLDDAWNLSDEVVAELDSVFGEDGSKTLRGGADAEGTSIIPAKEFAATYTSRDEEGETHLVEADLDTAIGEWSTASYPRNEEDRRAFQIRVQRALHDSQPVVVTWNVDFNAMENRQNEFQGSFNLTTLAWNDVPGRQGGHMTVMHDYQAITQDYGLLEAGVTLDPEDPEDAAKLDALLLPSTELVFLRIKNSWGSLRPDREFAPGFPGYHDLYLDYLDGPIKWCPSTENKTNENCTGSQTPFRDVMLPPGY